jgi:hypothetical protein
MGLFRRKDRRWTGVDFMTLKAVPTVEHYRENEGQEGERVVLLTPRFASGLLGRWLQSRLRPAKRHIRVPLEKRGTWLWGRLDGERTVADHADAFCREFPDDLDQAAERLCQYLYAMEQNGFVRFTNLPPR